MGLEIAALPHFSIVSIAQFTRRLRPEAAADSTDLFTSYVGSLWSRWFGASIDAAAAPAHLTTPTDAKQGVAVSTTATARSTAATPTAAVKQTVLNRLVIKPVVSPPPPSGVSGSLLASSLQLLRGDLLNRIAQITLPAAPASPFVPLQAFAVAQRIDALSGTTLTNVIVKGVSGLAAGDIPALAYLPIVGGTISGDLAVTGVLSAGSLLVSTIASTGAIQATSFTATSTTTSSTFPNLLSTNGSITSLITTSGTTTNATSTNLYASTLVTGSATSTNLFATLGHFTTGVVDTLTASVANFGTITATNATTSTLAITNAANAILATDATGRVYATSTPTAANFVATSTTASQFPYASTTAISSTNASTSNLIASNSFTLGNLSGFRKATAGLVGTALVNLASDVTGVLPVTNGGTGWAGIQSGTIPYGNDTGAVATSSGLTFDGTKLIATYASTTALSASESAYFATAGGKVGIGTSSPATTFSIDGTVSNSAQDAAIIMANAPSNNSGAVLHLTRYRNDNTGGGYVNQFGQTVLRIDSGSNLNYAYGQRLIDAYTGTTNVFSVDNMGLVTSQSGKINNALTVNGVYADDANSGGDNLLWVSAARNDLIGLRFQNWYTNIGANIMQFGSAAGSFGTYNMQFKSGTTGNLALLGNGVGNVGIGTTSPAATLDIANTGGSALRLEKSNNYFNVGQSSLISGDTTDLQFSGGQNGGYAFYTNSSNAMALGINNAGNVLIGTTTQPDGVSTGLVVNHPGQDGVTLAVDVTAANYAMKFRNPNGQVGAITTSGSGTTYNTSSDRRIKENIATTSTGLDILMTLPVRQFSFIKDPAHATTTGFIAQELYQVFPDAVTTNGDNGTVPLGPTSTPWSIDYGRITPLIVKAVQDIAGLSDTFKSTVIAWLGDANNGIHDVYATVFHSQEVDTAQLCIADATGKTCITRSQLNSVLAHPSTTSSPPPTGHVSASTTPVDSTPPFISVNGDDPTHIHVGDPYSDPGATIVSPDADKSLGINTSATATNTIDYVATNPWGNTATSTRTVIQKTVAASAR